MAYTYAADLHGSPATADIAFQRLYSYVLMSGEIRSSQAVYSFHADIYEDGGYGEMFDQHAREQFRIQIQDLTSDGFILISNPFLAPTAYYFRRVKG